MAGGFGSRLRPLTNSCPKPLLRVGHKPILELILENFVNSGFHDFYISTHYLPKMIQNYFEDGERWGVSIKYVHEETPLGTGGALGLLPKDKIGSPVIMMNGDLLTNLNFVSLLDFHNKHQGSGTVCVRQHDYQVPYGVVQIEGNQLRSIVEKPSYQYFVSAGIYVVSPELIARVPANQHIDMPTLLEQEMSKSRYINSFPIHEYWLDIGRMSDFQKAQNDVLDGTYMND
jgi:NDP-sugar pyrophosphorylase family protein